MSAEALALGLDLGTTRIKAGVLRGTGRLGRVVSVPAPPLTRNADTCVGDAEAYVACALDVLRTISRDLPTGVPLGLACQRSTFTLWDPESTCSRMPMISWQDRRAAAWCAAHRDQGPEVTRSTGLPLSPHYAGPKLAWLRQTDPGLLRALDCGELVFGTLDAFLVARCSSGRVHETDLTVAARTLLVDLAREDWAPGLLARFGVPARALPRIAPTSGRDIDLGIGPRLRTSLADQAAAALALLGSDRRSALVNLGTGTFVLRTAEDAAVRRPGYLLGPILDASGGTRRFAFEGPINGAGPALARYGSGPTELPTEDPAGEAFALPDLSGLGAPHWRPDLGLELSPEAQRLLPADQRRVVLEGLLFRIREIVDDLFDGRAPEHVVLSGGASRELGLGAGLAALLDAPVSCSLEHEAGLLGAAQLAAGLAPGPGERGLSIDAGKTGAYLRDKYPRWRTWVGSVLDA